VKINNRARRKKKDQQTIAILSLRYPDPSLLIPKHEKNFHFGIKGPENVTVFCPHSAQKLDSFVSRPSK